jgi:hypothetical protein
MPKKIQENNHYQRKPNPRQDWKLPNAHHFINTERTKLRRGKECKMPPGY